MRGKIEVDQTDFKQGVAYLFQLRKQQRVSNTSEEKEKLLKITKLLSQVFRRAKIQTKILTKILPYSKTSRFLEILDMENFVFAKTAVKKDWPLQVQ